MAYQVYRNILISLSAQARSYLWDIIPAATTHFSSVEVFRCLIATSADEHVQSPVPEILLRAGLHAIRE